MKILLGSQSPRRREILSYFTFPFIQVNPDFDEEAVAYEGDPQKYVTTLAQGKADSLRQHSEESLLITADTVVYCEGIIYNKPKNAEEAQVALLALAGKKHTVYTALCLQLGKQRYSGVEAAHVWFHPFTALQAHLYQEAVGSLDKAGGYAIQGAGSLAVRKIEGCYTNVMGFPISLLKELFLKFGVDLWHHIKPSS